LFDLLPDLDRLPRVLASHLSRSRDYSDPANGGNTDDLNATAAAGFSYQHAVRRRDGAPRRDHLTAARAQSRQDADIPGPAEISSIAATM
jgi:hypothetical protein